MYSLLRNEALRRQFATDAKTLLATQAVTLLPALLITQLFFHWKSFLLEYRGLRARRALRRHDALLDGTERGRARD